MSEKGPAINQGHHQIEKRVKRSVGSCTRVLNVSFSCLPQVLPSIRSSTTGGLGGKTESACEEFEDYEGGTLGQCL